MEGKIHEENEGRVIYGLPSSLSLVFLILIKAEHKGFTTASITFWGKKKPWIVVPHSCPSPSFPIINSMVPHSHPSPFFPIINSKIY